MTTVEAQTPQADAPQTDAESTDAKPRAQISRNVLVNWTTFAVTLLTGFWMSPFLIRNLGESVYGVWILIGSLVSYLGLLDFGITQTTVKLIAAYRARNDQDAINRVVTGGVWVFSAVGAFAFLASILLGLLFNRFFHTSLSDATVALVVALVGLNLAVTIPASVFLGVLRGYQRYDIGASAMSVSILLRSGFIVWAISRGYGLVALAGLTLFFDAARLAYVARRVWDINPHIRLRREFFQRDELRGLFGHSVWLFLILAAEQINFFTDAVVIGLFLPPYAITVYFIAFRLVGYLRSLVVEMVGVLMPTASSLHARDDADGLRALLTASAKFTLLFALPPASVFVLLGDRFIELWMGRSYAQSAALLNVLTFGVLAHLCELSVATVLIGAGRAHVVAKFVLMQALVNLTLSVALIRPFGLQGVAWATAVSMIGFALFTVPIYLRRHLDLSPWEFLRNALGPSLLAQLPWLGALLLVRAFVPMPTMSAFFGALALALPGYAAWVYAFALSSSERAGFSGLGKLFGAKKAVA